MTTLAIDSLPGRIRHRFPILERQVYVNSCSQGALSDTVRQAYEDYLTDWDERGAPWEYWVEKVEQARTELAALVKADPDEIAVTSSTSQGISALMSGMRFDGDRRKLVVTDFEFPTVGQIAYAQELRGAEIVMVAADGPAIAMEQLDEAIDERTALVAVTAVCYRNGVRLDVPEIVRIAHERGAYALVDAYQALGTYPIDVKALDVDFLAGGVLKYLLASAGLAFLYCRKELVEQLVPTQTGWFADSDIFAMDHRRYSPSPTARRFEAGTPPIPAIYAAVAGLRLMREIGIAETREHVLALNDHLIAGVDEIGGTVVTPREHERRGALVCIRSTDEHALVHALAEDGIVVSSRDGNLRVSPHCYNTVEDVEAILTALARHRQLLA
jgi:selenocysteine lyase/cysteine desulfurase